MITMSESCRWAPFGRPDGPSEGMPVMPTVVSQAQRHTPIPTICAMRAGPQTVGAIRKFGREMARVWSLHPDLADALTLIVSEYVTNSVLHSGSQQVTVEIVLSGTTLNVTVRDTGRWRRRPGLPADLAERGRGVALARCLARETGGAAGYRSTRSGTTAWAQLHCPGPP